MVVMSRPVTKRCSFRFSLRTLLMVVLLLTFPMGWFAGKIRRADQQRQAVRMIEKAGGRVSYEREGFGIAVTERLTPVWLGRLMGADFFADVNGVFFPLSDEIDDALVEYVTGLKKLTALKLNSTQVTHVGLMSLSELKRLELLDLSCTRLNNAGLDHLRNLTNLRALNLSHTRVTDAGLVHLREFTRLEDLWLSNTRVTDAGLQHLRPLTTLHSLQLSVTQVTDAGLRHLEGLTGLESLGLNHTEVTDAGLESLQALPRLKRLSLNGTTVTRRAIDEFRKALPNCDVTATYPKDSVVAQFAHQYHSARNCSAVLASAGDRVTRESGPRP